MVLRKDRNKQNFSFYRFILERNSVRKYSSLSAVSFKGQQKIKRCQKEEKCKNFFGYQKSFWYFAQFLKDNKKYKKRKKFFRRYVTNFTYARTFFTGDKKSFVLVQGSHYDENFPFKYAHNNQQVKKILRRKFSSLTNIFKEITFRTQTQLK